MKPSSAYTGKREMFTPPDNFDNPDKGFPEQKSKLPMDLKRAAAMKRKNAGRTDWGNPAPNNDGTDNSSTFVVHMHFPSTARMKRMM